MARVVEQRVGWNRTGLHDAGRPASGHEPLITHLFEEGAQYLDADVVFGTKQQLVVRFDHNDGGQAPDGRPIEGPWADAHYDFVLQPKG